MKLDDSAASTMTTTTSTPIILSKTFLNNKLSRQSSSGSSSQRRNRYMTYQRRQNAAATSNDFLNQNTPSKFSVPLLSSTMNEFFQATKIMEDEIMLPSRLKDMPIEESILDNSVQPNNWHELYTFVRDVRNQLTRSRPFINDDQDPEQIHELQVRNPNNENLLIANHDLSNQPHSSSSSTVSSDELEHSIASSNPASFDTIKDELKYHFFGLIESLDSLKIMANRVTEKYRDDSTFKI